MGGVRLDDKASRAPVLLDLTQSEIIGVSASAAERVVGALERVGEVRKAAGAACRVSWCSSLRTFPRCWSRPPTSPIPKRSGACGPPRQQSRLAEAIAGGVRSYFLQNPPDGTRFKQQRRESLASAADASAAAGNAPKSAGASAPCSERFRL